MLVDSFWSSLSTASCQGRTFRIGWTHLQTQALGQMDPFYHINGSQYSGNANCQQRCERDMDRGGQSEILSCLESRVLNLAVASSKSYLMSYHVWASILVICFGCEVFHCHCHAIAIIATMKCPVLCC